MKERQTKPKLEKCAPVETDMLGMLASLLGSQTRKTKKQDRLRQLADRYDLIDRVINRVDASIRRGELDVMKTERKYTVDDTTHHNRTISIRSKDRKYTLTVSNETESFPDEDFSGRRCTGHNEHTSLSVKLADKLLKNKVCTGGTGDFGLWLAEEFSGDQDRHEDNAASRKTAKEVYLRIVDLTKEFPWAKNVNNDFIQEEQTSDNRYSGGSRGGGIIMANSNQKRIKLLLENVDGEKGIQQILKLATRGLAPTLAELLDYWEQVKDLNCYAPFVLLNTASPVRHNYQNLSAMRVMKTESFIESLKGCEGKPNTRGIYEPFRLLYCEQFTVQVRPEDPIRLDDLPNYVSVLSVLFPRRSDAIIAYTETRVLDKNSDNEDVDKSGISILKGQCCDLAPSWGDYNPKTLPDWRVSSPLIEKYTRPPTIL